LKVGDAVGRALGAAVGIAVGAVGMEVGELLAVKAGAAVGAVVIPKQQSRVTLSAVGQQSPPRPSAAHVACALHAACSKVGEAVGEPDGAALGAAVGMEDGDMLGATTGVAVGAPVIPKQQSRLTPSPVGQQSPVRLSAAHVVCVLQFASSKVGEVVGEVVGAVVGAGVVGVAVGAAVVGATVGAGVAMYIA
jgi:hypothetical protein